MIAATVEGANNLTKSFFLVFHGYTREITKFHPYNNQWRTIGYLLAGRTSHSVIFYNGAFYVVGGDFQSNLSMMIEKCIHIPGKYDQVVCYNQLPLLEGFRNPALFILASNYT